VQGWEFRSFFRFCQRIMYVCFSLFLENEPGGSLFRVSAFLGIIQCISTGFFCWPSSGEFLFLMFGSFPQFLFVLYPTFAQFPPHCVLYATFAQFPSHCCGNKSLINSLCNLPLVPAIAGTKATALGGLLLYSARKVFFFFKIKSSFLFFGGVVLSLMLVQQID
jgi:hypothetical protein